MEPAQRLYEACRAAGVLNTFQGWETRDGQQVDARGGVWKTHSPGIKEAEKEKWRRVAQHLGLS